MSNNLFDEISADINNSDASEESKIKLTKSLIKLKEQKINLMITGCTGCGKSSTINALFKAEKAKIGTGSDPETMDIQKYELDNLILWDTPGLGDNAEKDKLHKKNIIKKLCEKDNKGNALIDLVLVIIDGSNRDMGTAVDLINDTIIPNIGKAAKDRVLIAINKADAGQSGRNWDYTNNKPLPKLEEFLEDKAVSVRERIKKSTGVDVETIYYSAGYKEEGCEQEPSYNLLKLLSYIVKFTPSEKRLVYINNISQNAANFKSNDNKGDYKGSTASNFADAFEDCFSNCVDTGEDLGSIFGGPGKAVGKLVGGVVGTVGGVISGVVDTIKYGCYITTATCEAYGKPDDCYELTEFRNFRDNWLMEQPDGKQLIQLYYRTAPRIVEKINMQPNRCDIYKMIRDEYLSECLKYIECGDNQKCKEKYTEMMYHLFEEEKKWQ